MRAPVSVIIPTLNAAEKLPATLDALYEGVPAGLIRELIVVDGGSDDETQSIAAEAGAELIICPPSRGGQMRTGAEIAGGAWFLFLHADTLLSEDWHVALRSHMADLPTKAGYFRLAFDAQGFAPRLVASWANLRSRIFGLPFGDQGLLIPRTLYTNIGGVPDIPIMEDIATVRACRGHIRGLAATALTSADRYKAQGWLRRGAANIGLQIRYFLGVKPEKLAARYRGKP